jgi:hypothetical protein
MFKNVGNTEDIPLVTSHEKIVKHIPFLWIELMMNRNTLC